MGNIGRSSTGCATCRKRKIKCDETRPGCRRCLQIRKPCPGYPLHIQLDIRQPQSASTPVTTGPTTADTTTAPTSSSSASASSSSTTAATTAATTQATTTPVTTTAVAPAAAATTATTTATAQSSKFAGDQVRSTLGPLLQLPLSSDLFPPLLPLPPVLGDVSPGSYYAGHASYDVSPRAYIRPGSYLSDLLLKDDDGSDDSFSHTPSLSSRSSITTTTTTTTNRPQSPLKYDIQHQAVCFFLHLFCFQAGKLYSFPILDFIPLILRRAPRDSPVSLAVAAVSRLTLADQYSGTDVRLQSSHEYSNAITSTMRSLKDRKVATQDATVVAVWLLGMYEAINSVMNHGRNTSRHPSSLLTASGGSGQTKVDDVELQSHISHIRGAMDLLRLRGTSQLNHPESEKIFRVFKAAIQMRLFVLNSITSRDFGDQALDNIYNDNHEIVPSQTARRASEFFLRIARLLEDMKAYIFSPEARCKHVSGAVVQVGREGRGKDSEKEEAECESLKTIKELIATAIGMDRNMEDWSDREAGWSLMNVRASLRGTAWSLYPYHAVHYLYSVWVFLYWIRYLVARVKLYEALIELVRFHPATPTTTTTTTTTTTSTTTTTTPFTQHQQQQHHHQRRQQQQQIATYASIIQANASKFIGLTAFALGDISPTGEFYDKLYQQHETCWRLRSQQPMNVVAAMQLVVPLKSLKRSEWLTNEQKGAVDLAIGLIGDGLRRQAVTGA